MDTSDFFNVRINQFVDLLENITFLCYTRQNPTISAYTTALIFIGHVFETTSETGMTFLANKLHRLCKFEVVCDIILIVAFSALVPLLTAWRLKIDLRIKHVLAHCGNNISLFPVSSFGCYSVTSLSIRSPHPVKLLFGWGDTHLSPHCKGRGDELSKRTISTPHSIR